MTGKEKQKAIDALKKSAPVMAMTQEEFNDYIQTLNKIMDWLEQEPCEDCVSRKELDKALYNHFHDEDSQTNMTDVSLGAIRNFVRNFPSVTPQEPFMNKPCVAHQVCHDDKVKVLEKIRAEIEFKSRIVLKNTPNDDWTVKWNECIKKVLEIIDKYKSESEE